MDSSTNNSENPRLVVVFGGSGFIGRHLVQRLARSRVMPSVRAPQYGMRIGVRRPGNALFLKPMGQVGQIELCQADVRDTEACAQLMQGAFAVVNLVGILQEGGGRRFDEIHAHAPARMAQQAANLGVSCFVHVSALGADMQAPARYGQSKALGESLVREAFPDAVVLRPSIVFGPEDDFFNRFAAMAMISPLLPLIGGGNTRFQPIYAGDVAQAIRGALERDDTKGKTFELGGMQTHSFRRLLEIMLEVVCRRRMLMPIPFPMAEMLARGIGWMPNASLTLDQVRMLQRDSVVSEDAVQNGRDCQGLGITPRPLETVLPSYLARFRPAGEFARDPARHHREWK